MFRQPAHHGETDAYDDHAAHIALSTPDLTLVAIILSAGAVERRAGDARPHTPPSDAGRRMAHGAGKIGAPRPWLAGLPRDATFPCLEVPTVHDFLTLRHEMAALKTSPI